MTDLCFKLILIQYTVNPDLRQTLWICAGDFRVIRQSGEAEENQQGAMKQTTPGRIQTQRSARAFFVSGNMVLF